MRHFIISGLIAWLLAPGASLAQTGYSISLASANVTAFGGIGTVYVTVPSGSAWSAISATAWIRVYSGFNGTGSGSFGYSVSPNLTQSARTGSVTVGGQTFTINQGAGAAPFPITWTPVGPHHIPGTPTDQQSGKLQALAIYYNNPNIMYTAGGRFLGPFNETGVFKTVDGGVSWTPVNSGLVDPIVNALWVDQTNPNVVLAGTDEQGIFKSTDGGQTWNLAANLGATSGFALDGTTLLAATAYGIAVSSDSGSTWSILHATSSTVWAVAATGGVAVAGTQNGTILVRTSARGSWQTVYSNSSSGVVYLAIDPLEPQIIYVGFAGHNGVVVTLMTRDSGNTWSALTGPNGVSPYGGLNALAVAPNSHVLYGASVFNIYSTGDGGQTWTTTPAPYDNRLIVVLPGQTTIILGSDQGLHKSTDSGKTWTSLSGSIYSSIVTSVAVRGSTLSTRAQDFSALGSLDGGSSWINGGGIDVGENGASLINPANPNYCYTYSSAGYQYSTDGCQSWQSVSVAELGAIGLGQNCCSDTIAVDPSNPSVVYTASQAGVFKSVDLGVTMTNTNWGLAPAMVIAVSPFSSKSIYVATSLGTYRTQDGGSTWSPLIFAAAPVLVNTIAVSPKDPNVVLFGLLQPPAYGGGVLKSTDGDLHCISRADSRAPFRPMAIRHHCASVRMGS